MDRQAFLTEKAANFCSYVKGLNPDDSVVSLLNDFTPTAVSSAILRLRTLTFVSGVDGAVSMLLDHCALTDEKEVQAARSKLKRYVEMFLSV